MNLLEVNKNANGSGDAGAVQSVFSEAIFRHYQYRQKAPAFHEPLAGSCHSATGPTLAIS